MPAAILNLQIDNRDTRERISDVIKSESLDLSSEYEVSVVDVRREDLWDLWIKRPDGSRISRQLCGDLGELTPAVFRIRLRELIKLL